MTDTANSKIVKLSDDIYEHFLREAGDITMADEWYGIGLAVADRFKQLMIESMERNSVFIPLSNVTRPRSLRKGIA